MEKVYSHFLKQEVSVLTEEYLNLACNLGYEIIESYEDLPTHYTTSEDLYFIAGFDITDGRFKIETQGETHEEIADAFGVPELKQQFEDACEHLDWFLTI